MYATKLGVHMPHALFCGMTKDIPKNMNFFGNKYVIKPLKGHSAWGGTKIKDGIDVLHKKPVSFQILTQNNDDDEEEFIVEELMQSINLMFDGLTPPYYKFFCLQRRYACNNGICRMPT